MKIAIISDIHGNYPALEAVLDDIEREQVDKIYCLGDLVGYYCMINEVIDTIRNKQIQTLTGNHDYALIYNDGIINRSKTCTRILNRHIEEISKTNRDYLKTLERSLSFEMGKTSFFCTHGGLDDPIDEYINEIDESYFEKHNFDKDVFISGHTHMVRNESIGKWKYLNPGSVGQPRDGNPAASYLIITEKEYKHKRVSYNIDIIASEMKQKGYEQYIYEILYRGVKVGG